MRETAAETQQGDDAGETTRGGVVSDTPNPFSSHLMLKRRISSEIYRKNMNK